MVARVGSPGASYAESAIAVVARRLAELDLHVGRAFVRWVRRHYSQARMPKRLADYFERGGAVDSIPSSVLASYGAVAAAYLSRPHAPKGLRVQAARLERVKLELRRRLG